MASTEGVFETSSDVVADRRAAEPNWQTMVMPVEQLDRTTVLPAADKQPIVRVETAEEVAEIDIGSEIKQPAVPEGANLIDDQQAMLEVQLAEEMDTATDPALITAGRDTTRAGYDCKFLDPDVASEYNCSICLSVSRDPQQTKCCGSTFCLYCIQQALASSKGPNCPNCNSELVELIPDKAQRQKINKLKVHCPIEGCLCIVELADVEAHRRVPHPVSPPANREPRQQYYNTLPIPPHKKQQVKSQKAAEAGGKRPVPTPRVPPSKSSEHDIPDPEPDQEVPENDQDAELPEYLNLTMRRPRVSRNKPESTLPESKRQRVAPYVNIDAMMEHSTSLQPGTLQDTDQGSQPQSETGAFSDQLVPLEDEAQPTTIPPSESMSNEIYENIVLTPKLHTQDDLDLSKEEHETEHVSDSEFTVVLKPRVPRDRPSSQPPPNEQNEISRQPSRQSSLSPPDPPQSPEDEACSPNTTPLSSSSITPQPDETVGSLPPPALDEFGMMDFQPSNEADNSPRLVSSGEHTSTAFPELPLSGEQEVPLPPPMEEFPQYVNVVSPGPQVPSLPDDLLALLANPTSPQLDQAQTQPANIGVSLPHTSSPQLHSELLTLPEQLLNMIQPAEDETSEPEDDDNAPLLSPRDAPEYVNTAAILENEEGYVVVSPMHDGSESEQSDYIEITSPPQEEESMFDYVPMSPFHEEAQPDYVEVTQQQQSEVEEPAADYVPMSPPPHTSQTGTEATQQNEPGNAPTPPRPRITSEASEYEVAVPLLQDMEQPEYETVSSGTQAREAAEEPPANEIPVHRPPPPPPEVVVALPQAQAPVEENYETIPAAANEAEDTMEHVYEALPPPRSPPTPEEPEQAMYADVPDPLPTLPPPALPPRSQSEPPERQPHQEPVPPVPPRPTSQTIELQPTTPRDQNQAAPVGSEMTPAPTTDAPPAQAEPRNQTDDGAVALNQVLQEIQQGNVRERAESLPPQYDDLSQAPRYTDLVQGHMVVVQPNQPQTAPQTQAYIIQNTDTAMRQEQGVIRADNVNIQYQMGDRDHHRNKNIKKTQTLL